MSSITPTTDRPISRNMENRARSSEEKVTNVFFCGLQEAKETGTRISLNDLLKNLLNKTPVIQARENMKIKRSKQKSPEKSFEPNINGANTPRPAQIGSQTEARRTPPPLPFRLDQAGSETSLFQNGASPDEQQLPLLRGTARPSSQTDFTIEAVRAPSDFRLDLWSDETSLFPNRGNNSSSRFDDFEF